MVAIANPAFSPASPIIRPSQIRRASTIIPVSVGARQRAEHVVLRRLGAKDQLLIDPEVHRRLGNRKDGLAITARILSRQSYWPACRRRGATAATSRLPYRAKRGSRFSRSGRSPQRGGSGRPVRPFFPVSCFSFFFRRSPPGIHRRERRPGRVGLSQAGLVCAAIRSTSLMNGINRVWPGGCHNSESSICTECALGSNRTRSRTFGSLGSPKLTSILFLHHRVGGHHRRAGQAAAKAGDLQPQHARVGQVEPLEVGLGDRPVRVQQQGDCGCGRQRAASRCTSPAVTSSPQFRR